MYVLGSALGLSTGLVGTSSAAVVYSDLDNNSGYNNPFEGATNGNPTTIVADDITPIAGHAGELVTSFSFSLYNYSTTSSTFNPTVYIYSNSATNRPGTLLASIPLGSLTLAGNDANTFTSTNSGGFFNLPSGTFWAGMALDGAPADTLNNIGQYLSDPPTVGSSADVFFESNGQATNDNDPDGVLYSFGGSPIANFTWSFETTALPEPASLTLLAGVGTLLMRRRAVR